MIKYLGLFIAVLILSCSDGRVGGRKVLISKIDSLGKKIKNVYKPGFGEIMSGIQRHHTKLWFGGINNNWKLASFEIHEINELLEDLEEYQSSRKETRFLNMISPDIDSIKTAIESKNVNDFKQKYIRLTNMCNDCHIKTEYEFIKIAVPDKNPFSDQKY